MRLEASLPILAVLIATVGGKTGKDGTINDDCLNHFSELPCNLFEQYTVPPALRPSEKPLSETYPTPLPTLQPSMRASSEKESLDVPTNGPKNMESVRPTSSTTLTSDQTLLPSLSLTFKGTAEPTLDEEYSIPMSSMQPSFSLTFPPTTTKFPSFITTVSPDHSISPTISTTTTTTTTNDVPQTIFPTSPPSSGEISSFMPTGKFTTSRPTSRDTNNWDMEMPLCRAVDGLFGLKSDQSTLVSFRYDLEIEQTSDPELMDTIVDLLGNAFIDHVLPTLLPQTCAPERLPMENGHNIVGVESRRFSRVMRAGECREVAGVWNLCRPVDAGITLHYHEGEASTSGESNLLEALRQGINGGVFLSVHPRIVSITYLEDIDMDNDNPRGFEGSGENALRTGLLVGAAVTTGLAIVGFYLRVRKSNEPSPSNVVVSGSSLV